MLQYFGAGDECHMAFHFPLMPRIYMAVATEDRHPIADIMRQTPDIPETCQWAVFLRNHDELTLEMVTDRERDYLWNYYAADRRARLNLGIRRRLAPLMENDRRKIELLNALLISMPGTPVFYYGDEIGMGDNVFLGDRDGVRTPMQWSFDRNGGFSRADPARLYLPPIMDPVYGFEAVNVEAQSRSPSSLLNWIKRLIAARRSRRAFGRGTLRFLYPSNRKVIAYLRAYGDEIVLCVANLSRSPQAVELDLSDWRGRQPVELLGRSLFPPIGELPYLLTLQGYSFFWFELLPTAAEAANLRAAPPEFLTLVMPHGWPDLFRQHNLPQLESDVIPAFLPRQRWFGAKDQRVKAASCAGAWRDHPAARGRVGRRKRSWRRWSRRNSHGGERQRYFLPLAAIWSSADTDAAASSDPGDPRRIAAIPPRRRACRRLVAGRLSVGVDGSDPAGGDDPARRRRDPLPQDADLRSSRAAGAADGSPQWGGTVEQLDHLRRLRDAENLSAPAARSASRNRDVAVSGRARRVCEHAAAAGVHGARSRRRMDRRPMRSACCSALSAIKGTAGPRRWTISPGISTTRCCRAARGHPICPIPTSSSFRWRASSGFALPRCIELWPSKAAMTPILPPNR